MIKLLHAAHLHVIVSSEDTKIPRVLSLLVFNELIEEFPRHHPEDINQRKSFCWHDHTRITK